jgi:hypothetical protein
LLATHYQKQAYDVESVGATLAAADGRGSAAVAPAKKKINLIRISLMCGGKLR